MVAPAARSTHPEASALLHRWSRHSSSATCSILVMGLAVQDP
ncbi:hypothetical protein [Glycomyces dulcitolivorans]|nr:hypothetical protein [Glycomyces dulcitolivorans]